ncbi:response regulator [Plantactinospora siamensis]|uniref:Response regulator n=1 Tax=Plantactinospora siamensis TaxID=555372 RepID=A0ABV6NYS6_9ACTN
MIRLILADDHGLVRAGLRAMLAEPDITVVAEASDGAEAVRSALEHRPDVVLMDVRMPVMDGIEATRRIVAEPQLRQTRVVLLTTFDEDEYVYEALRIGASGFLLKDIEPIALVLGVRAVAQGDAPLAPAVTRRLITDFARRPRRPDARLDLDSLTRREYDVLMLVVAGLSNGDIADRLGMSPATAKTHITRILTKVDARDRAQLVVLAYESGLVQPGWLG